MIKLVACDLDGTLLDSNQEISNSTIKMIQELSEREIEFMIVSGRDFVMANAVCENYHINCDMILNNGHEYISKDKSIHCYFEMVADIAVKVLTILHKYDFHITVHTDDGKYIFQDYEEYYKEHIRMSEIKRGYSLKDKLYLPLFNKSCYLKNTHKIEDPLEIIERNIRVLKIDAKNMDTIKRNLCYKELSMIKGISVSSSYESYIEICSDNSNKGVMLQKICEIKGIKENEVCVFGDGSNDIEMLQMFPLSFAVSNAKENIKECANFVTFSNNDDGVLKGVTYALRNLNNR